MADAPTPEPLPVTFVDNPHAPDVYASTVSGIGWSGQNVITTFESIRIDHSTSPGPYNRVVIGRLVIPVAGAQALVLMLNDFLTRAGHSPTEAVAGGQTAQ